MSVSARLGGLGLGMGLLLGVGWLARPLPRPPDVFLISLDTLRADHVGAYGGSVLSTPNLDAFALDAVVFERAYAAAPTTLASHTSLMTGRWPNEHGVPRNGFVVHEDNHMLAERLSERGYHTIASVSALPLDPSTSFDQGFSRYQAPAAGAYSRSGVQVTAELLDWLRPIPGDPVFAFAHYFEAHAPYGGPATVAGPAFASELVRGKRPGSYAVIREARAAVLDGSPTSRPLGAALRHEYARGVRTLDHRVGDLLKGLKRAGLYDEAIVVIVADHGEAFDTHEEAWDHGYTVYDETVHVPLMIKLPGGARGGSRVADVVSLVDLPATVMQLAGHRMDGTSGRSLVPLLKGGHLPERPAFSEATKPWGAEHPWPNAMLPKAVRSAAAHVIVDPRASSWSAYDPAVDPGEMHDIFDPVRHSDLKGRLSDWAHDPTPLTVLDLDEPDMRAGLEALGYVEGDPEATGP